MLTYTVIVTVQKEAEPDWLPFMLEEHIPDVVNTGCFTRGTMRRRLEPPAPDGFAVYAIAYECPSRLVLDRYLKDHAPALREDVRKRYEGKFSATREVLEAVEG